MYASLVCVQFMYSTSLETVGLARKSLSLLLVVLKKNDDDESQTLGLESPVGDSRQKETSLYGLADILQIGRKLLQ